LTGCLVAYFTTGFDGVFATGFDGVFETGFLETTAAFFLLPPFDLLATTGLAGAFTGAFFFASVF
jgi:hypothetical protein